MTFKGFVGRVVVGVVLLSVVMSLAALTPISAQETEEEYVVGLQLVADGLTAPVAMAYPNDGTGRMFVVDQTGTIWGMTADGQIMATPFLDLSAQMTPLMPDYDERGVLGLAFHPDYASNGRFFVYYTIPLQANAPAGWDHTNVLAEFHVSADNPDVADPASQAILVTLQQPQFNHNAGHIAFGPDGYLYIPIGDGGGANDVGEGHTPEIGNGQDISPTNQKGSILRIDVNGTPGTYAIPTDNPFAANPNVAPEIYAYGFRNPYHISFDRETGQLFAADAGQDLYEEVSLVTAGGNYGWFIKEGTHCFDANAPENPPAECATTGANGEPLIDPIIEYSHAEIGIVVVGGYVYRGAAMPDLVGYYLFGDYTTSQDGAPDGTLLWAEASEDGSAMWSWGELRVAGFPNERVGAYVRGFGEGPDGELYIMTGMSGSPSGNSGQIWKLVAAEAGQAPAPANDNTAPLNDNAAPSNDNTAPSNDNTAPSNDNTAPEETPES